MSNSVSDNVPEEVAPIVELMSTFRAPWALCGGWAIDAWLGRQTRDHGDVDISVFNQDSQALFEHLGGWQLVAHAPNIPSDTHQLWDGRPLPLPAHIHARLDRGEELPASADLTQQQGFILDILLDDRSGDDWVLSRAPRIRMPVRDCVQQSPWGLPTVVPGVLLFFKASELRRRDRLDFSAMLSQLDEEERNWLRDAISVLRHPWLSQLSA